MIERFFQKQQVGISRELCNQVSQHDQKAVMIVLTLLYSHIKSSLSQIHGIRTSHIEQKKEPRSRESKNHNPDLIFISQSSLASAISDEPSGKSLYCAKALLSLFIPNMKESNIAFTKSGYHPTVARDILASALEGSQSLDYTADFLSSQLNSKASDIIMGLSSNNLHDVNAVLETFLPLIASKPSDSFICQALSKTLCFFGEICQQSLAPRRHSGDCLRTKISALSYLSCLQVPWIKYPFLLISYIHSLDLTLPIRSVLKYFWKLRMPFNRVQLVEKTLQMPIQSILRSWQLSITLKVLKFTG